MIKNPVQKAFDSTASLIFGRPLGPIERYEEWLFSNMPKRRIAHASDNGKTILLPGYSIPKFIPEKRIISMDFLGKAGNMKIAELPHELHALGRKASEIALFSGESQEGQSSNNLESNFFLNLNSSYRTVDCYFAKNCGCEIYSSFTENSFGCFLALYSKFVINCYYSTNLSVCFEMDGCHDCSNSMFCHNCENVNDSLFCFNAKNLKYAVGNSELGKEDYLRIRKAFLADALKELESSGKLELSIYNIGCY
ncbi:MAG: hypothetical protein WC488_00670 [Candidatus Micrarchaeia archaeon]